MLFNNDDFISYIEENFVGVAADDVAYNNLPADGKARGEFVFLDSALKDGGASIHQGVYAITPSGKFLGKIDTGWPTYDPVKSLENLKSAKRKYEQMARTERLRKPMDESARSLIVQSEVKLEGGTKLLSVARHYAFDDMELFDLRHPEYSKRDSLWFSAEETQGLLPKAFKVGETSEVDDRVVERLLLHGHLMFGCPAWWSEHIKRSSMSVKVLDVKGESVKLGYTGDFLMDADSRWNKSRYEGKLLGVATWNTSKHRFESLEWVSLGDRGLQELKSNLHRGDTKTTKVAAYLRLVSGQSRENKLLPHKWDEYPREVKQGR